MKNLQIILGNKEQQQIITKGDKLKKRKKANYMKNYRLSKKDEEIQEKQVIKHIKQIIKVGNIKGKK